MTHDMNQNQSMRALNHELYPRTSEANHQQFYTFQRPDNLAVSGVRADERVGPRRQIVVSTRPLSQCPHNDVFTAIIYNKYFYFEPGRGCCPLFSSPGLSVVCRDLTQFVWSSRELAACGQLGSQNTCLSSVLCN